MNMNKNSVALFFLMISLLLNAVLLKLYFDAQSNQVVLEKGILMNEYIDREKELRNFNSFVRELAEGSDEHFSISEEQSRLYWILAAPEQSEIMKVTHEVQAHYGLYNNYLEFLNVFDREYKEIINRFKLQLPLMNKDQLAAFAYHLDETYTLFKDKAFRDWEISRNHKKLTFDSRRR